MKLKAVILTLIACSTGTVASGQSITEIANADPLLITGAIGTQNTFNYAAQNGVGQTTWNNSIYANLNFQVFGVSMPFTFNYVNSGTSFSYPHFSFRFNPTFRGFTLYAGKHTMAFSNYVYNTPVDGIGLEYRNNKMRFGAFYGTLRKSVNDDPLDPTARNPQYQRTGWGFKAGYGTTSRYIDIFVFRAFDKMSSLDERWYDRISPQENLVVGAKGRFNIKRLVLSANFATSAFTQDTRADQLDPNAIGDWGKIFDARLTSLYRFAGDMNVSWGFKHYNFSANYKLVQPDYMTLGTNYLTNNIQSYGVTANGNFFRGKVSANANFSKQQDNITKRQLYTTSGYVYGANASWMINNHFNFTGAYNGYRQIQTDGIAVINDTTRVNRIMHGVTSSLGYSLNKTLLSHYVGLSYNFSKNNDLNHFNNGQTDVETHAAGLNYTLGVMPWQTNFNWGLNYQNSKNMVSQFSTKMITFGTSRSFLADRSLNLGINANLGFNECANQKSTSFGTSISAGYTLKQVHIFSLIGSYSSYRNIVPGVETSMNGKNYTVSLSYNYAFTLLHIQRKAKEHVEKEADKEPESEKAARRRRLLEDLGKMVTVGN